MIAIMILNLIVSKEKESVKKIIIQIDDITAVLTTIVIDDHDQMIITKLAGFHHRQRNCVDKYAILCIIVSSHV